MTSSYRLGDLVILSNLTDNEKNQLCLEHPNSIGYDYIKLNLRTILFSNDIENNIKHITEIVLNFIKNNLELFPEDIEDSIVIHTRIGDVVAGINSFEIEKRPFDISYLKSIVETITEPYSNIYVIGKCHFGNGTFDMNKYEECLLLDCFAVNKSKDFESFLHNHETIRGNRVADLKGHETELELFLIGKNLSYKTLLDIINNNVKYFNTNDTSKIELENEQLRLMLEMKNTNNDNLLIQELLQMVKQMSGKIDNLEKSNREILSKLNTKETKVATGFNEPLVTLGPRLQKINPETLELVKVYESVSEAIKEDYNIKRPSINKAIVENTIYLLMINIHKIN